MYEAFLQVNIIKGEVTNDNYKKINCTYLDEELDNFLDNFINPQDDWNIQHEKNYFSVKEIIDKVNKDTKGNSAKQNKTRKGKAPLNPNTSDGKQRQQRQQSKKNKKK